MSRHRPVLLAFVGILLISTPFCFQPIATSLGDEPAGRNHPKIDVGVQLYSLRAQMEKDLPGTLRIVHDIERSIPALRISAASARPSA